MSSAPAKRGPGRPPRADKATSDVVRLRVTAAERQAWERAAGELSLSAWIREACAEKAAR